MNPAQRIAFCRSQAEIAHTDLKTAVAQTDCGSERTCISHGTCLGRPMCKAIRAVGTSAGFIVPEPESSEKCGQCVPSFGGVMCFCPTRWALFRIREM